MAFAVVQELDQETAAAYHSPGLEEALGKQSLVEVDGVDRITCIRISMEEGPLRNKNLL